MKWPNTVFYSRQRDEDEANRFFGAHFGAVEIVRDLAGASAPHDREGFCAFCDDIVDGEHDSDCPWRRAVEWVADNPEAT